VIDINLYLAFVLATSVLILIPGPNVALIVANSVTYGTRYGLLTVAGTSSAIVGQLALAWLGMTALLGEMAQWFDWIRWAGVAYLLWLGFRQWTAAPVDLTRMAPQQRSPREIFSRGILVSFTNPKTLFFYGAFFPQFVTPGANVTAQIGILAATFLVIAAGLDAGWALLAGRVRHFLAVRGRLRNRISGGVLIGAGLGLALVHRR
jgi:homoserine/homoserine lactone efflux protein